ncbi:MAG: NAD(P)H-quinone oxidoreductase subunit 2, chloroplastic [Phycisphaerae bacterium]|nr:NAD(P)H-quinone oxidoreductase subunit 2, chloroplastic [Phycisphaerae bacterium]
MPIVAATSLAQLPDAAAPLIPWYAATLPFWPLIAALAVLLTLITQRGRTQAHKFVVGGVGVAAFLALHLFFVVLGEIQRHQSAEHPASAAAVAADPHTAEAAHDSGHDNHAPAPKTVLRFPLYRWISLGGEHWIDVNFFVDSLAGMMLVTVTFVGLMVVIYAVGYMRDHHGHPEPGYERFFAFLGLFIFSMCMLVLAGNFALLYLGWELVGLCSYLLIGFYYQKPEAAAAAKKAFLVNRIGDFGFALGIFALYMFISPLVQPGENPLDYAVAFKYAAALSPDQCTLVSLLLLCGALGKSAQLPLHVWLPDAMEGPTPVSALIHAATMVTAGVYMVARCGVFFVGSPIALTVVTAIGAATAIFAASMAMAQYDMKRILAYSTISQLAYMFVGLGCGAPDSAIFHLYTHAFFKALLFLCAGSVMHAMGGVIDVRQFSGLRAVLPQTCRLTRIGCLALAGFPLLSGFWSKDEIVHAAFETSPLLGALMLLTALMTAYYTFRMFFLAFGGPTRLPPEAGHHPHESPAIMLRPLAVLAFGAIFAGYLGVRLSASRDGSFLGFLAPGGFFHDYLASSTIIRTAGHEGGAWLMYLSSLVAVTGIVAAWVRYGYAPLFDPDPATFGRAWRWWHAKYYVDECYDRIFVRPLRRLGEACFGADRNLVDGLVNLVAAVPTGVGLALRSLQRGSLQAYGLGMAIGIVALLLWWFASAGGVNAALALAARGSLP